MELEVRQHAGIEKGAERRPAFNRSANAERRAVAAWANGSGKRTFDLLASFLGLILLSPILLIAAAAVLCTSDGDALFAQERSGRGSQTFTIYKFRTMCDGAEFCGPSVTREGDPRMTTVGRWLRSTKLDELPQLYNVLRGDMSFVGPRPKLASHECGELPCRPGITGAATLLFTREEELLAQVPADLIESFTVQVLNPVKARLDHSYAQQCSLRTDLELIAATVFRLRWDKRMADLADLLEGYPEDLFTMAGIPVPAADGDKTIVADQVA